MPLGESLERKKDMILNVARKGSAICNMRRYASTEILKQSLILVVLVPQLNLIGKPEH
jgi:hypothetical protein